MISSTLELISKDKIHHLFGILPLITFILLEFNLLMIVGYTIAYAIWEVYIVSLTSFKTKCKDTFLNPPELDKKLNLTFKKQRSIIGEKLSFIYNLPIFLFITFIIVISFIHTLFCAHFI